MLILYLILFLALSAALTWWRVTSYQRQYEPVRIGRSRRGPIA